jgi:chromosome partitioning protein
MSAESGTSIELVGISEIAEMAGMLKQNVANIRLRDQTFPQPIARLRMGPVYLKAEAIEWINQRITKRRK